VVPVDEPPKVTQQFEVVIRTVVTEHRQMTVWCESCQAMHDSPLPESVRKAGLCGPALTSLIADLKGPNHCSYRMVQEFLHEVCSVMLSTGFLVKVCHKVSGSVKRTYEKLEQSLRVQRILNIDETGHKEKGRRLWTWVFRSALLSLLRIDESRGSKVLIEVLGEEFEGVIECDYFSAYSRYNDGLSGFTGNDVLNGERGFDRLFVGDGNDTLTGGNARDTMFGGAGDDSLAGNDGDDTLVGGTGNNDASRGDVFDGLAPEIDEAFMLDTLPGWGRSGVRSCMWYGNRAREHMT